MMAALEEVDNSLYSQHQKVFPQISVSLFEEIHPADQYIMPLTLFHFCLSLPKREHTLPGLMDLHHSASASARVLNVITA